MIVLALSWHSQIVVVFGRCQCKRTQQKQCNRCSDAMCILCASTRPIAHTYLLVCAGSSSSSARHNCVTLEHEFRISQAVNLSPTFFSLILRSQLAHTRARAGLLACCGGEAYGEESARRVQLTHALVRRIYYTLRMWPYVGLCIIVSE